MLDLAADEEVNAAIVERSSEKGFCRCTTSMGSLWPKDCCMRTDAGSKDWKPGEWMTCDVNSDEVNADCGWYCKNPAHCLQVGHPNDKQGMLSYLLEKASEINNLPEDMLLARASWQAQMLQTKSCARQDNIAVAGLHQLHPVGSWREDTWKKTEKRKDAILAAKSVIQSHGGILTEEDMNKNQLLKPMESITSFIAVPFPFCGNSHVLLEGNGRVKAMKLAAAADPDLANMKVEVTLLCYDRGGMKATQEGIALLWNQYVNSIDTMNSTEDAGRITEYGQFKVSVVKCLGEKGGLLGLGSRGPCRIVGESGELIGQVPVGELFGVSSVTQGTTGAWRYEMCGAWASRSYTGPAYVVTETPGVVEEFCPKCAARRHAM